MNSAALFLVLSTLFATSVSVSNSTSASASNDMVIGDEEKLYFQYSFEIGLSHDIALFPEEEAFVVTCFEDAYNDFHDPKTDHLTMKQVISETHTKLERLGRDRTYGRDKKMFPWQMGWTGFIVRRAQEDPDCKGCPIMSLKSDVGSGSDDGMVSWEAAFCSKLVEGPFEVFKDAENCKIAYKTIEEIMAAAFPAMEVPAPENNLRGAELDAVKA